MKNLHKIIIPLFLFLSSCTETVVGPRGEQGPIGAEGAPGESGYVLEIGGIDFTAGNDYQYLIEYQDFGFEGLDSDVALVYFLWPLQDGLDYDVWRLLPQQWLLDEGILQYNYDFTATDVRLFLDANFPLDILSADQTDAWVARVVIVPGSFWGNGRIDATDYSNVKEMLGLPDLTRDLLN